MRPLRHPRESERLAALHSYDLLDSESGEAFDALTRLAARVCQAPMSLISLIDDERQWILSRYGIEDYEDPRTESICSDAVAAGFALVIPDLTAVSRYADLPSVTRPDGFRTYAGIPLVGRDGLPLGTLCVLDTTTRRFDAEQLSALHALAEQVVAVLEPRRLPGAARAVPARPPGPGPTGPVSLRRALDDHVLVPHFQARVDLRNGHRNGLEALVRWRDPHGTLVEAGSIPGAVDGELANWTARAMLEAAAEVMAGIRARSVGLRDGVAVEMRLRTFGRRGAGRAVLDRLGAHKLPGSALTVQITESGEAVDLAVARRELLVLRDAGIRVVAIFGFGWSNLVRLMQLPISGIGLAPELMHDLIDDEGREHVVRSAITLGTAMNLTVGAQGVDTEAVRDRLLELGCVRGQGSLFGEPVTAAEIPALDPAPDYERGLARAY